MTYDESKGEFEELCETHEEDPVYKDVYKDIYEDVYPDWLDPGSRQELIRAIKLVLRTWMRETMILPSGLCEWMIEVAFTEGE